MSDLIDKWAAIEIVSDARCGVNVFDDEERYSYEAFTRVIDAIKALPSAQPDIIRCKECRFYEIFPNGANGNCKLNVDVEIGFYPWDFCSHAERKEEND